MADNNTQTAITYKVEWGDTLSEIAEEYIVNGVYAGKTIDEVVKIIVDLNDIKNKDLIYAGQTLTISGPYNKHVLNTGLRANVTTFARQSHNENVLFAVWTWDKKYTASYQIRWKYKQANGTELYGVSSSISHNEHDPDSSKYHTFEIPKDAISVSFQVKPVCSLEKENYGKYWEADWSTKKTYNVVPTPPKPEIRLDEHSDFTLIAEVKDVEQYDNMPYVEFQLIKNNSYSTTSNRVSIGVDNSAEYVFTKLSADSDYRVRCRGVRITSKNTIYSSWSELSDVVATAPAKPGGFKTCKATSETSVYLEWTAPNKTTAKTYNIEYTTNPDYFDVRPDDVKSVNGITMTKREIANLESGKEYFFRLQAVNEDGKASPWSTSIKSIIIGEEPGAPTTWSSSTMAVLGESFTLYWIHNSQDDSDITSAQIQMYYDDDPTPRVTTINYSENQDENDTTKSHVVDTGYFSEGMQIRWRVRTAGITGTYGDWSVDRYVDVYSRPRLDLGVLDELDGSMIDDITSYPIYISGVPYGGDSQHPIGYYLSIVSNDDYETVDSVGNLKMVSAGDLVFSKYYDETRELSVILSAGDVDLENNISYTIRCSVSMDSGLEAENSVDVTVAWEDYAYWPNAVITIDPETIAAHIGPRCLDNDGLLVGDIVLSVYRREFDGSFTEIASNIENSFSAGVTDPHPSLDYARYRIVAMSTTTGAISYYDQPGYPVNEKSVVIQWDETWSEFDFDNLDTTVQPTWSGSMLKLPYNINVSDSYAPDVSLIEYIGREHPVSYYGTQLGETSSWSIEIDKEDKETLYALRRLAKWMGNAYVREPSGSGYWANVTVSFSQNYDKLTIPVTLDIKRVEGGV